MIEKAIEGWHEVLSCRDAGERNGLLDALLADDVVFYSPVVFTPQRGKTVTKLYLAAAGATFEGDVGAAEETGKLAGELVFEVGEHLGYVDEIRQLAPGWTQPGESRTVGRKESGTR